MKKENVGYLEIIIAQFLFSFMYIFVRFVESFGSYNLAFSRVFLSALFLFIISLFYSKWKIMWPVYEKTKVLIFGALHGFIILAAYLSIYYLSIASAMILQSTLTLWMVVFSYFILKEKITTRVIISLILSLVGLVILFAPSSFFFGESILGSIAGLFVGIFGGLIYVLSKTFKKYDKVSLTFWQNAIATPFLIPLLFFQRPEFSAYNLFFVFVIALCGLFGFLLLFFGLRYAKGSLSAILTLLNPVITIILAFLFFKEIPSLNEIIGGLLIFLAVYLILSQKNK